VTAREALQLRLGRLSFFGGGTRQPAGWFRSAARRAHSVVEPVETWWAGSVPQSGPTRSTGGIDKLTTMPGLSFVVTDPGSPAAAGLLREYWEDIVGRYYGRPALAAEVDAAMADEPSDDLQGAAGMLVLALESGTAVACGGVRFVDAGLGELTRIYSTPAARGRGAGAGLIHRLDALAAETGRTRLRLTVRSDLVEAIRLYRRLGYVDVAPFGSDPYADHWLAKKLYPAT
jgi:GNAT superfamily N-acetyltransferase